MSSLIYENKALRLVEQVIKRVNAIIEMQRIVEDNLSRLIESALAEAPAGNDNLSLPSA